MREYKRMALNGCLTLIGLFLVACLAIYGAYELIVNLVN